MNRKILVIDDFDKIRLMIIKCLKEIGYSNFEEAENGREALKKMEGPGPLPAVIISDWNMPEMNGIEFLDKIKLDPRFSAIPVILVTAEGDLDQIMMALKKGASDYIIKPVTAEALQRKLSKIDSKKKIASGV